MSTASTLYPARPRSFRIGGAIRHKTDLSHFVRWPEYVRIQKQKRVLAERLKVPPSIEQFGHVLNKNITTEALKLFENYRPDSKKEKKAIALEKAKAKLEKKPFAPERKKILTSGLNEVTKAIERKKAKLVLIAHDVDPIELVLYLPALCRKMEVPYAIVNNKARLGTLCHMKKSTALCLTSVNKEDEPKLAQIVDSCKELYGNYHPKWGGGVLGLKTQQKLKKREDALKAEITKA